MPGAPGAVQREDVLHTPSVVPIQNDSTAPAKQLEHAARPAQSVRERQFVIWGDLRGLCERQKILGRRYPRKRKLNPS
jgi:hypothetical protein